MAGNVISATITADGSKFNKTLGELQAQLKRFENALKNAGSIESFNRLNRAIEATKGRIQQINGSFASLSKSSNQATGSLINLGRVVQDAPFGFLGIANNLNPLIEGFGRLRAETGSTGSAFKSLASSLAGAGGLAFGVSLLSSALILFGDELLGTKTKSEASEAALNKFKEAVDNTKESVNDLSTALQFANSLGALNIEIAGLGDLTDLREQSIAQVQFTQGLERQKERLKKIGEDIAKNEELNGKDRAEALDANFKAIEDINDKIEESENAQRLIYRRIALQKIKDQKDANKKLKEDNDKFIDDTIARAKELSAFLERRGVLDIGAGFDINPFKSRIGNFEAAKKFIEKALNQRFAFNPLKTEITQDLKLKSDDIRGINIREIEPEINKLRDKLQKSVEQLTKTNPILVEFEFRRKKGQDKANDILKSIGLDPETAQNLFRNLGDEAVNVANTVNNVMTPAFTSFFDALKKGVNPIKAFFEAIGQAILEVIQKFIQAAITAAIFNAILGGGGAGFASLFKQFAGFRAGGGPVNSGKSYIVGENGPELFVPNTGGRIIPNNSAVGGGLRTSSGMALEGTLTASGYDIVAVVRAVQKQQGTFNG